MRLKGRQAQFLIVVLLSWSMARAYWLWPSRPVSHAMAQRRPTARPLPQFVATTPAVSRPRLAAAQAAPFSSPRSSPLMTIAAELSRPADQASPAILPASSKADAAPPYTDPAPAPLFPPQTPARRRIEAQAYLVLRPGSGAAPLADHGELGGSQIAARIAVPVGDRFAAAARVYAPLEHPGAEAAIGIDWHPFGAMPLRISVERRQRLDAKGRSAWSAYAAGGFYRGGGPGTAQFDGYAQAGVVGAERRDGFVDGALRIGYRLPEHGPPVTLGAGLWGAAQPGVSRIDAGPRMAVTIPVDRHSLTFAAEGRFRMAGRAAPGSGAALTLATDF